MVECRLGYGVAPIVLEAIILVIGVVGRVGKEFNDVGN
jgi:hypothetical protein